MRTQTRAVARAIRPLSRMRQCPPFSVLAYHRIDEDIGGMSVSPRDFRAHLDWLDEHRVEVVPLEAFSIMDGTRPRAALTFDDGYRSVADVAWPELRARGLPATLYVVSRTLRDGHRFSWDTTTAGADAALIGRSTLLDLAADGLSIGSHTRTHVYLPSIDLDRVGDEVAGSRRELEDELGQPVTSFSYPQGGWNASIRSIVARAGYQTAVTMDRGAIGPIADPLALARRPAERDPIDFEMSMDGLYDFLRPSTPLAIDSDNGDHIAEARHGPFMTRLSDRVRSRLRCPACGGTLIDVDRGLECDGECRRRYPMVGDVPVLIHEENSVFSIQDVVESQRLVFDESEQPGWLRDLRRALPSMDLNVASTGNFVVASPTADGGQQESGGARARRGHPR